MGHPLSWSDEAAALRAELPKHERTSRGVLGFFRTLRLDSRGIAVSGLCPTQPSTVSHPLVFVCPFVPSTWTARCSR